MFLRIATILKRLMGFQSMDQLGQVATTPSSSANNLLVTSGQRCQDALAQHQQSQSAPQKSKGKRKAVQQDTQAPSRKRTPKTVTTTKKSGQAGSQPATPAKQSRQGLNSKRSVVQSTSQAQSSSKGRITTKPKATPAGKPSATRASKTRQHAK